MKNLKEFLDNRVKLYNTKSFIVSDPISIPHKFNKKEDIEIIGFLTSMIAWGKRKSIVKSGNRLINILEEQPHDFIKSFSEKDLKRSQDFVHRTFNSFDLEYFLFSLKNIYLKFGGLEEVFSSGYEKTGDIKNAIVHFRNVFFELPYQQRTSRHVSNPEKKSAAKRINMFLRWMVRKDNNGVDFGLWNRIPPSALCCPLDVHSGNVARALDMLKRKQNDWQAVEELTSILRKLDPDDPVKYDYALFGIGVFENFNNKNNIKNKLPQQQN